MKNPETTTLVKHFFHLSIQGQVNIALIVHDSARSADIGHSMIEMQSMIKVVIFIQLTIQSHLNLAC